MAMKSPGTGSALLGEALFQAIRQAVREEMNEALKQMVLPEQCAANAYFEQPAAYLTVREAAALARLATSTIRLYIRKGQLQAYKEGSRVIIKRSDLEAFLEAHPIKSSGNE
jgi:excisionase family DNA binding protein